MVLKMHVIVEWGHDISDGRRNRTGRFVYQPDSGRRPKPALLSVTRLRRNSNDLARDPYFGRDNSRVTSRWP